MRFGDILIPEVFTNICYRDIGYKKDLIDPHVVAPHIPDLENNKRAKQVIRAVKLMAQAVDVPVMINLLAPHPKYLRNPAAKSA